MQVYFKTTLRLWNLLKDFHIHFYVQLCSTVSQQLINIYSIYLAAQIINKIIEKNFESAYTIAITVAAISIFRYLLFFFSDRHSLKYLENGVHTFLQGYSLKRILSLNSFQFTEDHSAIKLIVISRGEGAVKNIISTIVLTLIPTVTQVVFSIIAIAFFSKTIALITAATFIIVTIWSHYFSKYHGPFVKKNIDNWDEINKHRTETFQHLLLIKNSGVEKEHINRYINKRENVVDYDIYTWNKANINGKARMSFFALSKLTISLQLIYQAFLGAISIGSIYAIWSWTNDAFNNIFNIVQATRKLPIYFVELEKYLNVIDRVPSFNESGAKKYQNDDIVLDHVYFKYPASDAPALHDITLTIPKGKKIGFVGFSGSGKSTIIKLLLRIYDWEKGDIRIGNKSLREIDSQALRQKIGYVEQHVDLFDSTVKENILFGVQNKKITNEKLMEIVHKARIDQFFDRLGEKGLDTIIGERGVKLSGGERQRIGIARALAKEPEILIFDEATASLDTENERYIQEAIDESSKGRTTIVVAHRLSTTQNSDLIFVMDKGKIVASGDYQTLLDNSLEFKRLVYAQEK